RALLADANGRCRGGTAPFRSDIEFTGTTMAHATDRANEGDRGADRCRTGRRKAAGWVSRACLVALLVVSFGAAAQRVEGDRAVAEGTYAAEVVVNGQGADERRVAFS